MSLFANNNFVEKWDHGTRGLLEGGEEWAENRLSAEGMRDLTRWQYGKSLNAPPAGVGKLGWFMVAARLPGIIMLGYLI